MMRPVAEIGLPELDALVRGCAWLGGGGGGDTWIARAITERALAAHGPARLVDAGDLADDDLVLPVGLIGTPVALAEMVVSGDEEVALIAEVEHRLGRPVAALMPLLAGGVVGVVPVAWAARLGLPLVDADGMGRVFPEYDHSTMRLAAVPPAPIVLVDGRGSVVAFAGPDERALTRFARAASTSMGGIAAIAAYPMPASVARRATIAGSVSRSVRLGEAAAPLERNPGGPAPAALRALDVGTGRVVDVRRVPDRWTSAVAVECGTGATRRQVRLETQSEYLLALVDGVPIAGVPDLIIVLDLHLGAPVATEDIRVGQRVRILALPAPPIWRSQAGLELSGPQAFGIDVLAPAVDGGPEPR